MAGPDRPIILGVRLVCPVCADQCARADDLLHHLVTGHRDRVESWTGAAALTEAAVCTVASTLRVQIRAAMSAETERRVRHRAGRPAEGRPVSRARQKTRA